MLVVVVLWGHPGGWVVGWWYREHQRHLAVHHGSVRGHPAPLAVTATAFSTAAVHPSAATAVVACVATAATAELHVSDLMGHLIHVPDALLKR